MKSENINELAQALAKAQGEFPVLEKKSKAYNYMYADLAETIQAVQDPLNKYNLSISHEVVQGEVYKITTVLMHSSGQWISTEMPLLFREDGKVNAMQALGSAITYAKRYSIGCLLNLAADKEIDDDGVKAGRMGENYPKDKIETLTMDQVEVVEDYLKEFPDSRKDLLARFKVTAVLYLPKTSYDYIVKTFEKKRITLSSKEFANA